MNSAMNGIVTIATAIVGIAILAVLVSRNSNTANVIGAGGSAFAKSIQAAVSPITGGGFAFNGFGNQGYNAPF